LPIIFDVLEETAEPKPSPPDGWSDPDIRVENEYNFDNMVNTELYNFYEDKLMNSKNP